MKKPKWKPSWAKGDPNLLLLDPSYIKHLNEQRDYAQHLAKKLDRESKRRIKPDWDKWPDTVPVLLWEAIALSLNCEPKCLPGLGRDPLKPLLDFEKCPAEFRRRLEIAKKRISELEVNSESCIRVEEKEVILSRLVAMSQSLMTTWKFPKGYPSDIGTVEKPGPSSYKEQNERGEVLKPLKKKGENWTPEHRKDLLSLVKKGKKIRDLMELCGVGRTVITEQLSRARVEQAS